LFSSVLRRALETAVITNGVASIISDFATGQNIAARIDGIVKFGANGTGIVTHYMKDGVTILLDISVVIDKTRIVTSAVSTAQVVDEMQYLPTDFGSVTANQVQGVQTPCTQFTNTYNNMTADKRATVITRVCSDVTPTDANDIQKPDHIKLSYEYYHPFDVAFIGLSYYSEICILFLSNSATGSSSDFTVDQVNMLLNINFNGAAVGVIRFADIAYVRAGDSTNLLVNVNIRTVEEVPRGLRICFVHIVSDLATNTPILYDPVGGYEQSQSSSAGSQAGDAATPSSANQRLSLLELF